MERTITFTVTKPMTEMGLNNITSLFQDVKIIKHTFNELTPNFIVLEGDTRDLDNATMVLLGMLDSEYIIKKFDITNG